MSDLTPGAYDKHAKELAVVYESNAQVEDFLCFLKCLGRSARVLDLGCASAFLAPVADQASSYYTGVDRSSELIRLAPPGVDVRVADVRTLPFPDHSFDGVWCVAVLQHLETKDLITALQEIVRVLKPNGACRLSMEQGTGKYVDSIGRSYHRITKDDLSKYLTQLSISDVKHLGTQTLQSFKTSEPDKDWFSVEFVKVKDDFTAVDDDCPLCPVNDWPNFEQLTDLDPLRYIHGGPLGYLSVDVSPIAPEHLLYVPTRHALSLAQVHESDQNYAMGCVQEVVECCSAIQELSEQNEVVIAEHGPVCRRPGHTCIAHTHLHLVRMESHHVDALAKTLISSGYTEASDLLEAPTREADYVAFKFCGSNCTLISKERDHPSQELRRLIGEVTGAGMYRWQEASKSQLAARWRASSLALLCRICTACLHRSDMEYAR